MEKNREWALPLVSLLLAWAVSWAVYIAVAVAGGATTAEGKFCQNCSFTCAAFNVPVKYCGPDPDAPGVQDRFKCLCGN